MVPPDGARIKRIPTLSWDSVVDTAGAGTTNVDIADRDITDRDITDRDIAEPAAVDPDQPAIAFQPMQLDSPAERAQALAPPPPSPRQLTSIPAAAPLTHEVVETTIVEEPVMVRTAPPTVIVPAIGDVTSGPEPLSLAAVPTSTPSPVDPAVEVLPPIQEATPVLATAGPSLPAVAPAVARPAEISSFEFVPASVSPAPTRQPQHPGKQPRKHRGKHPRKHPGKHPGHGGGVKLVATLVVLGGLVAAGVVFGKPYLFPGEWDGATAPYADAVEAGRGVEFAEPLAIVGESTGDFGARLRSQLAPVSDDELAQWRAFGLVNGAVDDDTLARQLAGWQAALYSTVDGQVYHDLGAVGAVLDAQLVQEMTAASLDQEFGWSLAQSQRTLDAAAATSAEVLRQSRALQQSSAFDAEVAPVRSELVEALPPVIGYRMVAPHIFAEFDAPTESDRTNPLADLGIDGPRFLGRDASIAATGPTLPDGDTVTTSPIAKDRSFWYLVFAGYLDTRTAYAASEAVVENAVTGAARGATQCASATFSGGGVEQTATLRSALTAWATAAPVEMSSSFQVLPDGTLQLVSCDPGVGFDVAARPDVARELLAWRMAELATMEAVRVGGGGEAELVDAWAFVQASPAAIDLMALPPAATPSDMAAAAQDAVNALFIPAG